MCQARQVARKLLVSAMLVGILLLGGQMSFPQPPAHGAAQDVIGEADEARPPVGPQQAGPKGDFPGEGEFDGLGDETWRLLKEGQELDTKELHVRIDGHTDSVGSAQYNEGLSLRRAEATREYFVQSGIAKKRLLPHGLGESQPRVSNDTAEGRAQNRRIELVPEN